MARQYDYSCSNCGQQTARDRLIVKKVVFLEMGAGGRTVRGRVAAWLCPDCIALDEDYNRQPHVTPTTELKRVVNG